MDSHEDKEILFGSAECWLSDNWRRQLTFGSLKDAEFTPKSTPSKPGKKLKLVESKYITSLI